jgi:hypothetical protein
MASYVTEKTYPNPWPGKGEPAYSATETGAAAYASATAYWSNPRLSAPTQKTLEEFAQNCLTGVATAKWEQSPYRAIRQNALRMLIATSPDMQVS